MKILSIVSALIAAVSSSAFVAATRRSRSVIMSKMTVAEEFYIDEERRFLMNMILLGSAGVTVGGLAVPYFAFFVPPDSGGKTSGSTAKDVLGNDIVAADYLTSKLAGDRSLTLGLKGDPTYLIVKDDKTLESYGLNAICTHLGCVVPWYAGANKFECPCHGSQYDPTGVVIRGPAQLPFALAHCDTDVSGKVLFTPWTEMDFRTDAKAWWN